GNPSLASQSAAALQRSLSTIQMSTGAAALSLARRPLEVHRSSRQCGRIDHGSSLHHQALPMNVPNLGERVGIEEQQVREFALLDRAHRLLHASRPRSVAGDRDYGLTWRHAEFDESLDSLQRPETRLLTKTAIRHVQFEANDTPRGRSKPQPVV